MMASTLPILLLLCACTFALPKDRVKREGQFCAPHTPCQWEVYDRKDVIGHSVPNSYCVCAEGKVCAKDTDDDIGRTYIYTCKDPDNTS